MSNSLTMTNNCSPGRKNTHKQYFKLDEAEEFSVSLDKKSATRVAYKEKSRKQYLEYECTKGAITTRQKYVEQES